MQGSTHNPTPHSEHWQQQPSCLIFSPLLSFFFKQTFHTRCGLAFLSVADTLEGNCLSPSFTKYSILHLVDPLPLLIFPKGTWYCSIICSVSFFWNNICCIENFPPVFWWIMYELNTQQCKRCKNSFLYDFFKSFSL